jgi:hypothetical protein
MPRFLLSVNVVITESRTLPSTALGKDFFAECPTKKHSAKSQALGKETDSGSVRLALSKQVHTSVLKNSNTF